MLLKNTVAAFAGLIGAAHATPVELAERQLYCPAGPITQVIIATQVITYPVIINQFFGDNTIININGGVTININNAPVQVSTTVTATTTVTSTVTVGAGTVATPFILQIGGVVNARKRQLNGLFVGANGAAVTDCSAAVIFSLSNNQLFSNGQIVSTNTGAETAVIAASGAIGGITGSFSQVNNVLQWVNTLFNSGRATFGISNGLVIAAFSATAQAGVAGSSLTLVAASSCSSSSSSSTSGSSTTSAASTTAAVTTTTGAETTTTGAETTNGETTTTVATTTTPATSEATTTSGAPDVTNIASTTTGLLTTTTGLIPTTSLIPDVTSLLSSIGGDVSSVIGTVTSIVGDVTSLIGSITSTLNLPTFPATCTAADQAALSGAITAVSGIASNTVGTLTTLIGGAGTLLSLGPVSGNPILGPLATDLQILSDCGQTIPKGLGSCLTSLSNVGAFATCVLGQLALP